MAVCGAAGRTYGGGAACAGNDNHVTDGAAAAVAAQGLGQALAGTGRGRATGRRETQGVGVWGVGGAINRGRVRGVEGHVRTQEQDGLHGPIGEEETA